MNNSGPPARNCASCKHWANSSPLPDNPGVRVGQCTALIFPAVDKVLPGKGAQQLIGGLHVATLQDSFCTFFYQPKLQALANWGHGRAKAAPSEPLPPIALETPEPPESA